MRTNTVRATMASGTTAINAWVSLDSSYSAEIISQLGYDSVTIDAQHGMFGRDTIMKLLQAVSTGPATPMVRPSSLDFAEIGWLLDAGAYGIIAPSTDTPALAQELVDACFYPPFGRRSFGPSRGLLYGGGDYVEHVRDVIMPWAMIESKQALENLDAILATPGLFGVYIGPNDLALDLGLPAGGPIQGTVADLALDIAERAHQAGLVAGIFCANGVEAARWANAGFDLVTPGNDVSLLRAAGGERIAQARNRVAQDQSHGGY